MKQKVLSVRNPVWADVDRSKIDCVIRTSAFSVELPFTASPDDPEEHGRDVFRRCLSGEFGEIGSFAGSGSEPHQSDQYPPPSWETPWPEVYDFINEANDESKRGSPRAIGLVWGSMLEVVLRNFIKCELERAGRSWKSLRCPPSEKHPHARECRNTFFDLIEAAVHERFIDDEHGQRLHAVRAIRNACAHEWRFSFNNLNVCSLKPHFEYLRLAYFPEFLGADLEDLMKMVYSTACCANLMLSEKSTPRS